MNIVLVKPAAFLRDAHCSKHTFLVRLELLGELADAVLELGQEIVLEFSRDIVAQLHLVFHNGGIVLDLLRQVLIPFLQSGQFLLRHVLPSF